MKRGPLITSIIEKYTDNIYNRQSEQDLKSQLHSFATENGYSQKAVEESLKTVHVLEHTAFGEQHTRESIKEILNYILDHG